MVSVDHYKISFIFGGYVFISSPAISIKDDAPVTRGGNQNILRSGEIAKITQITHPRPWESEKKQEQKNPRMTRK